MRQCKQCGATFLYGEALCAYCGEPLIPGARRKESTRGREESYSRSSQSRQRWDYSAFEQGQRRRHETSPPINMFRRSRWDSIIAAVLAFALGTFGVHWFFLGNRRRGIWYAIFFWTGIPTILGIIDGAMLLGGAGQDRF